MQYNEGQRRIIQNAVMTHRKGNEQVYEFAGWAGTGKTEVLKEIIRQIGVPFNRVAPMAFIGQAAIVLRTRGFSNARTIHSWIYDPDKKTKRWDTYLNRPIYDLEFTPKAFVDADVFVVDEAGSVPYKLKADILKQGKFIIASGDLGQLDPVMDKPAFLTGDNIDTLDTIVRQGAGSGILYLAERIRKGLPIYRGFYGDVWVIDEDELTDEMLLASDIILCGKNETRDKFNKHIRESLYGIRSDLPIMGEKIVCRKNNWDLEVDGINLANGLTGRVVNMPGVHGFDGKTFEVNFQPNMLNNPFKSVKCDYKYFQAPHNLRQAIKMDKYSPGEKFELAYACTTHMSQGSEYYNGIYIQENLGADVQIKLDYTGITRFRNAIIFVKKKKKFF